MNISTITHETHIRKDGINEYAHNVINTLECNRGIKKINIFSK
tara:strand:- start:237 stop:365 length:129 start_codon:yes stop_codon:yes gene_type:complete